MSFSEHVSSIKNSFCIFSDIGMGRQLGYPLSQQAALTAAAAAAAAGPGKARSSMNLGLLSGRSAITGRAKSELCTRQHCRVNLTMFLGLKMVDYIAFCLYSAWLLLSDAEALKNVVFFLVPDALIQYCLLSSLKKILTYIHIYHL